MAGVLSLLDDFGTRSLITHAIMSITLPLGFLIGLTVDSQLGLVSFVALLNFTAGMWICQSIHARSRRQVTTNTTASSTRSGLMSSDNGIDAARLGRLLLLIGFVTAVSLLTSAQVLPNDLFSVAVVAIGSIALVTAIIGFLIAAGATYDDQISASGR